MQQRLVHSHMHTLCTSLDPSDYMQAEGVRNDLRRQLVQVQRLQEAGKAQKQHQEAALKQAQDEVLEAVQQGNHKYAAMLAEHMSIEDELKHQLASKQQAAASRSAGQLFVRG